LSVDVIFEHLLGGPDSTAATSVVDTRIPSFLASEPLPQGERAEDYLDRLPKEPFILYVGALSRLKGLAVLFDAYRKLASPPPLVLLGTPRPDKLDFPLGVVVMTNVPNAVIMAAWDRALFGVMPSLWPEPFGTVVAEAMSRGRPVVGTRTGGHGDMLDESSGILVPQGDPEALARAMADLIGDPDRRAAMGLAAQSARGCSAPSRCCRGSRRFTGRSLSACRPSVGSRPVVGDRCAGVRATSQDQRRDCAYTEGRWAPASMRRHLRPCGSKPASAIVSSAITVRLAGARRRRSPTS